MSSAPTIHLQRAKMLVSGIVYPVYRKLWWSKRIWRKQITYVFKTIAWLCWKSGRVILFLSPLNSTHHTIRVEIPSKHISLRDSNKRYTAQTEGAIRDLKFWTKSSLLSQTSGTRNRTSGEKNSFLCGVFNIRRNLSKRSRMQTLCYMMGPGWVHLEYGKTMELDHPGKRSKTQTLLL